MTLFAQITMIDYRRSLRARADARKHCGPYTWQPAQPGNGRGFYQSSKGLWMDEAGSSFALRLEYARDLLSLPSRYPLAYYCDGFGDDTMTPIVARLPHGRGFLAGWTMGKGMCGSLDAEIYRDAEDAARAAFATAEADAEKEREYQERERDAESEDEE